MKWQGYSSKHNSWIPTSDIIDTTKTADTTTPVPTVSAFSGSNPTMPFKCPINNILPYFIFTFCFLTYLGPLTAAPNLGPLYDCSRLYDQAYFTLPKPQNCSHSMKSMNASIQFYRGNVYQPFAPRTPLSLFHCVADIREFNCHQSFFGSKSKHYSVHSRTVSPKECLHAVKTHISPFGRLFPTSST